ncbi:MAG: tol-pal system protein YbgF, partial [Rhodobacteraceae bacterium]|nr:tol-pal system protein YbgF [Paracoccaceae bacterium]
FAQDRAQMLADIRQDLNVLYVEMQRLKRELSTTQSPNSVAASGSVLDRLNALEAQVQQLTAATEQLDFRIGRVVSDGTNRIGDLEFRLVELEGGDISTLGETTSLGGDLAYPEENESEKVDAPELAVGERADFDMAQKSFAEERYGDAIQILYRFSQTYPDSPLAAEAMVLRGASHEASGDYKSAARAYLESFSTFPKSAVAPKALMSLGNALVLLGQTDAGCQTLSQVDIRFPDSEYVQKAADRMAELQCL